MTTDVTSAAAGGALAALGGLRQGLQNIQTSIPSIGGLPILKLEKDGRDWLYGADNVQVEEGSLWAVNPLSFKHGYVNWKKRPEGSKEKPELFGEVLVGMNQTPPDPTTLPVYTEGAWTECVYVELTCVSGEDEGTTVQYKPNSKGGLSALKELLGKILARPEGDINVVPVVELNIDSYDNKSYGGRTYIPLIEVRKWASLDTTKVEDAVPVEDKSGTAAAAKIAEQTAPRGRRAAAAPAPETTVEEEPEEQTQVAEQPGTAQGEGGERRRRRRV